MEFWLIIWQAWAMSSYVGSPKIWGKAVKPAISATSVGTEAIMVMEYGSKLGGDLLKIQVTAVLAINMYLFWWYY
jgi:hypothetical protein